MDELMLFSPDGAAALLEHLSASFDAPPSVKLAKATSDLHTCTRGNGTVSAYVVRFRTASTRFATAGDPLPDRYLGGMLLRNSGLSHEQQAMVQVAASSSAVNKARPSFRELAEAMDCLHGHLPPPPVAMETVTLTAAEHTALLAAAAERGPLVCWHCHKEGHVRFHCPDRQRPDAAARPPTPPLPRVAPAAAGQTGAVPRAGAAPRQVLLVSSMAALPSVSDEDNDTDGDHKTASASVLTAAAHAVGDVIVDPGATATVAGVDWLRTYVQALSDDLRATVVTGQASVLFRFGDARTTLAEELWEIPIQLAGNVRRLRTHVIPGGLPLLLSRPALKAARALIDMEDDTIWLKDVGAFVPVYIDRTGHMRVSLLPPSTLSALSVVTRSRRVSFGPLPSSSSSVPARPASTSASAVARRSAPTAAPNDAAPSTDRAPVAAPADAATSSDPAPVASPADAATSTNAAPSGEGHAGRNVDAPPAPAALRRRDSLAVIKAGPQLSAVITGLHRTYAHPGADRLIRLLHEAGCRDPAVATTVRRVTTACGACRSTRSRPPRSVVTLPRPTLFNDTVAMDLAEIDRRGVFLHLVDLGTRLSRCIVIPDKEAGTVVRALLTTWICVYGACRVLLSDPGREFHNQLLRVLAERFNIRVDVTAAQSAWSNGVCERHNGVIKHMVAALAKDYPTATLQELLDHACFAKNCLAMHGCASPFQLATGSQPRLPSVLSDDMPAMQEGHLPTEVDLAKTVAMLAASRAAFATAEASQSVRRALNRRVPGDPGRTYNPGDLVRYWEQSQSSRRRGMHGPAKVVSQAGRVVRLLHGGEYKTRNASDVEMFSAPDPAATPTADPGVVGAALSALRHVAGPAGEAGAAVSLAERATPAKASNLSPASRPHKASGADRRSAASAVSLVIHGASARSRHDALPDDILCEGAALVAAVVPASGAVAVDPPLTGLAATRRDEGWGALVAHAVLITRRELRARNEVASSSAGPEFDAAKEAELLAWMVHGAYREEPFKGQRVLSMRWVLTVKPPALPGLVPRLKARLCARGNEERGKAQIDSFSPTVARSTVRLLVALLVTMGWEPRTVDVSTAFLQGMPIDRPHPVWVRPPREARVPPGIIWRLAKCAYGLVDAPLLWYRRVKELLCSLGAICSPGDNGLFVLPQDGRVVLAVAVHVDDFLYGGTRAGVALFETKLQAAFSVGPVGAGSLVFTGLALSFSAASPTRPASAWVHQQAYVDCLDDIPVDEERMALKGAAVTSTELTLYRRATGALLWAAGQTLPHLACGAAVLARHFKHALVADLLRANKLLGAARGARDLGLRFRPVAPGRCFYLFTDSSAVTLKSAAAQSGFALFLGPLAGFLAATSSTAVKADTVDADLIAWGSHRQRRVTHSSYAAEAFSLLQALHTALDAADVAGLLFDGVTGKGLPVHAFTDSRALYDSISSTSVTGSKEVRAAVAELREHYRLGTLASVTWLPGSYQLADGLTKPTGAGPLRSAVASGRLSLPRSVCVTKSASGGFGTRS